MRAITGLMLLAALGLAGCGDRTEQAALNQTAMDNMAMAGAATDGAMPAVPAPAGTPDFIQRAAISDMFEIESARLVLERSKASPIRDFAGMMIADHQASSARLKQIVAAGNLAAPPAALDAAHRKMLDDLRAAPADDFDETYLDQQTEAHNDALTLLDAYASGGDDAALKAFAGETAPKVRGHLERVKALDDADVDDAVPAAPAK